MVTVSHVVEKIVQRRPFLQEALSKGIVNNASLAESLIPEIESELRKKVKFSAVNMAIRRLSEKLEKTFVKKVRFEDSDISLRSDLVEIILHKTDAVQKVNLTSIVDYRAGDLMTITQGLHEIMIITNKKHEKKITALFPKKLIKKIIKNLNSLTIHIPPNSFGTVGIFYTITRALSWEDISIVDMVSTFTEATLILRDEDTARAFEILKNLLKEYG